MKHSAALRCRCSEEVFEDEDTKSFYEGLPNLKMQIPGYLLTQLAAASEKDDAEEGEKVCTALSHLRWAHPAHICDWAHRCRMRYATGLTRICTGARPTSPTSAPGLGSPLPHLHQDWAHICSGTGR